METERYCFITSAARNGPTLIPIREREIWPIPGAAFRPVPRGAMADGRCPNAEALADFSVREGGRGDDGTDRPALLQALMLREKSPLGFSYAGDGLRNDLDTLFQHIAVEHGVALCNLRVGHIVALVAAREVQGVKQLLAIDSYSESAAEKVRDHVLEVLPDSVITYQVKNSAGLVVGENQCYGMFWVEASLPRDFNLLHPLA